MRDYTLYEEYIKFHFEGYKNTDADYFIVAKDNNAEVDTIYGTVPYDYLYNTVDEAVEWYFKHGWDIVEIYDLYSPFEKALIRRLKKVSDGLYVDAR